MNAQEQFRAALAEAGLAHAGDIIADRELHRFKANDDREANSWYVLFPDSPMAGAYGCWKRNIDKTWCEKGGGKLTESQSQTIEKRQAAAKKARQQEKAERQGKTQKRALELFNKGKTASPDHHYLAAKHVMPQGQIRQQDNNLIIPLRDVDGVLHSLQYISPDGTKRFLKGGKVAGCFCTISEQVGGPLIICEGYATGATLVEATGLATIAAMNCGNLKAVAKAVRAKRPGQEIIIAADNDLWTEDNPGLTEAVEVAKAIGAKFVAPRFRDTITKPTDFNDLGRLEGLAVVKEQIESAALVPEGDEEESDDEEPKKRKSAATLLVEMAKEFSFFHDSQNRAYARLAINGHTEIWPVNSSQFRQLLSQSYYKCKKAVANRNAIGDAITALEGYAQFEGPEEPVYVRSALSEGDILIDLCDSQWRVVRITAEGWKIEERSPVAFVRTRAMRALPLPLESGSGSLEPLWNLLNVTAVQRPLMVGALLNHLHPSGPYFVLNLVGEQGCAKSCAAKIHRQLVDPNEIPLRSPPGEERDLLVHAANNRCVALDNLSKLSPWLSDGLCRLSTGGGHSARQLYTDGEEFTLSVKRPCVLNGIEDVASRPDLAERTLQIELEPIPDNRRMRESVLWERFEQAHPAIFSKLLDGMVRGMRDQASVELDSLPRMADAAIWVTAAESAFGWERGTFMASYWKNIKEGASESLNAHPVGIAIRQLLENVPSWQGEPTQLLEELNGRIMAEVRQANAWPKSPRSLSACLRRLAQALRRGGIDAKFGRTAEQRTILLSKAGNLASTASPAGEFEGGEQLIDANDAKSGFPHDSEPESPDAILL